jgi:hypothetical protein
MKGQVILKNISHLSLLHSALKILLAKNNLAIFAAKDKSEFMGYCIASANNGAGEIDSLYIKTKISWLITWCVAYGNHHVMAIQP